ncbi:hypothetical protein A3D85_02495 [Candidatus Amesbacteria bacterium RIFCSPHIGHO2_02_FULL_47_9]|uniref:Uncharacterized protein n=1 Tax=Candidatus Amesbacteria bacterium RIFCSPHIGHO2_01_FULL_48_32b TaxID=1797253 RepID=A0A1F4YDA5_9BACT|nr:MAG: hypothetical protein A2876_03330 [Candidatus Amesbacteria bacterium RIFCSPHIGHO2_01_FULL_48_32b]OGD02335.1 MAG: hypothetical protein A3D85_02495 [Candidatus Amesbacteria bacterium RIFCSPHIGHO2_02_FULL_47_9]
MAKEKLFLIFVLVFGLGLRLINLNQSFWLDETSQAHLSSLSLFQIWSGRGGDFHPPLFYFLAHFWMQFSRSETWLRLLPVSFGAANIYVVYIFARKHFSQGLLTSFLFAIAPFHIYYSQEFRSYSLLCLLGTLAMYFLLSKKFSSLALTNLLLLYTHYSSVFLLLSQVVYLVIYERKSLSKYTIQNLLFILLYLPWLPQFLSQLKAGTSIDVYLPGWRDVLSISPLKALPVLIFKLVAGRITILSRPLYGIYIAFVFGVVFAALYLAKSLHKRFLFVWIFVPVFTMMAVSLFLPQTQPFRLIYVLPALVFLFSSAISRYPKMFLTFFFYIFIFGSLLYFTRPRLQREQWRQAITFLQSQNLPVLVKFADKFAPFYWYSPSLAITPVISSYPAKPDQVANILSQITSPQVLLLQYLTDLTDPDRQVDINLQDLGYQNTRTYNFEGVGFIEKYQRP